MAVTAAAAAIRVSQFALRKYLWTCNVDPHRNHGFLFGRCHSNLQKQRILFTWLSKAIFNHEYEISGEMYSLELTLFKR